MLVQVSSPYSTSNSPTLPALPTTKQLDWQDICDNAFDNLGESLTGTLTRALVLNKSAGLGTVEEANNKTGGVFTEILNQETTSQSNSLDVSAKNVSLDSKLPLDTKAMIKKLDNGFTYCIRNHAYPSKQTASLRLVVRAGSVDEKPGEEGIAHFLEHLTFLGTETYGDCEIKRLLESKGSAFGADQNANTSYNRTLYKFDIPLNDPGLLDKALHILREMTTKAKILESSVEAERSRVLDEINDEKANRRFFKKLYAVVLDGTPYPHRAPSGLKQVIQNCTAVKVRAFYQRTYQPQNMALFAFGDFDPEQVESLIHKHFADIPFSSDKAITHDFHQIKKPETQFVCHSDPEITRSYIELRYPLETSVGGQNGTVGGLLYKIVNQLYLYMFDRRLNEIQTNFKSAPFSAAGGKREGWPKGIFYNHFWALARDGEISEAYRSLLLELRRVEEHGFLNVEFDYAMKKFLAMLEHQEKEKDQTPTQNLIVNYTSSFADDVPFLDIEKKLEIKKKLIKSINVQHVNLWSKILLSNPGRVVSIQVPEQSKNNITLEILTKIQEEVFAEKISPYANNFNIRPLLNNTPKAGKVVNTTFYEKTGITEWILENGMRVFVKLSTQKEDTIRMVCFRAEGGGYHSAPIEIRAAAKMSADVCGESKKGGLTPSELKLLMADKNISQCFFITNFGTNYQVLSTKKDFEFAFQLIHTVYTDQIYTEESFNRSKMKHANDARHQNNDPNFHFLKTILSLRTQDHPRFQPISEEEYKKAELKDCIDFLNNQYQNPSDFDLCITGNLDLEETKKLVETYMAGIPGKGRQTLEMPYTRYEHPQEIVVKEIKAGIKGECKTCITFPSPTEDDFESKQFGRWIANLLTLHLIDVLVCESKKSYTVQCLYYSTYMPGLETINPSTMQLQFRSLPGNIHEVNQAVLDQLKSLHVNGFTKKEVDSFKTQLLEKFRKNLDNDAAFSSILVEAVRWKFDLNKLGEYFTQLVHRFDEKMATELFRKHFPLNRYVQVTLLPMD